MLISGGSITGDILILSPVLIHRVIARGRWTTRRPFAIPVLVAARVVFVFVVELVFVLPVMVGRGTTRRGVDNCSVRTTAFIRFVDGDVASYGFNVVRI